MTPVRRDSKEHREVRGPLGDIEGRVEGQAQMLSSLIAIGGVLDNLCAETAPLVDAHDERGRPLLLQLLGVSTQVRGAVHRHSGEQRLLDEREFVRH